MGSSENTAAREAEHSARVIALNLATAIAKEEGDAEALLDAACRINPLKAFIRLH